MNTFDVKKSMDIIIESKEITLLTKWSVINKMATISCVYGYVEYISDPFEFKCKDPSDLKVIDKWINSPYTSINISITHELGYISIDLDNEYAEPNIIILKGQPDSQDSLKQVCMDKVIKLEESVIDNVGHYFIYINGEYGFSSPELKEYIDLCIQQMGAKVFASPNPPARPGRRIYSKQGYNGIIYSNGDGSGKLSNYLNCTTLEEMSEIYMYIMQEYRCSYNNQLYRSYTRAQILMPTLLRIILSELPRYVPCIINNEHYKCIDDVKAIDYFIKTESGEIKVCTRENIEHISHIQYILRFEKVKLYTEEEVIQSIKSGKPLKVTTKYGKYWY